MKTAISLVLILLLPSCATGPGSSGLGQGTTATTFLQRDVSGEFRLDREIRWQKRQLASRTTVRPDAGGGALLEKTFALSTYGTVKGRKGRLSAVRPELSQHTVWLEGKEYFSQLKLVPGRRILEVIMRSPEVTWRGKKEVRVPRARVYCFYSQLPECLRISGLAERVSSGRRPREGFMLVWDSYPYHREHFTGLGDSPFAPAVLVREKSVVPGIIQLGVEVAGQSITLHFNKGGDFARLFWVTQGITVVPPAEAEQD